MKARLLAILLVVVFVLGLVPVVSAQGDFDCFNLSPADCEIVKTANANMDNVNSFAMTFNLDAALTGLGAMAALAGPEAAVGDMSFTASGSGTITVDPATLDAGDLSAIQMVLDMDMSSTGPDAFSLSLSLVITDGIVYFLDPDSGQWIGMPMDAALAQSGMGGLGLPEGALSPGDLMSGDAFDTGTLLEGMGLGDLGIDPDAFAGLGAIPGFINFERLADESMMGQTMYPFSLTMDFTTLFQSTEFLTMVTNIVSAASAEDPSMAQMGMLVPLVLSSVAADLNITEWVGADDMFVHGLSLDINGNLDLGAMMPAGGSDAPAMEPIAVGLHLDVELDQLNGTFEYVAPEGAMMLTPEMLGQ